MGGSDATQNRPEGPPNPQFFECFYNGSPCLREHKSTVLCPRRSLVTRFSRANRRSSAAAQTPYEQLKPLNPLERGLGAVGQGGGACSRTEICVRVLGAYSGPSRDHQHSCTQPGGWRRNYDIIPQQNAL